VAVLVIQKRKNKFTSQYKPSMRSLLIVRTISILHYFDKPTLFSTFCFNFPLFLATFS
jgi:hypothetical protein